MPLNAAIQRMFNDLWVQRRFSQIGRAAEWVAAHRPGNQILSALDGRARLVGWLVGLCVAMGICALVEVLSPPFPCLTYGERRHARMARMQRLVVSEI